MTTKTPAMVLQELSMKMSSSPPDYNLITHQQGTHENLFEYQVCVMGVVAYGMGRSKKEAKQEAARNALNRLDDKDIFKDPHKRFKKLEEQPLKQVVNHIGLLGDICLMNNIQSPEFTQIAAAGPSHAMEFTYECIIGTSIKTTATATTKRTAKQLCAERMLERIKDIVPDLVRDQETDCLKLCESEQAAKIYPEVSIINKLNLNLKVKDYSKTLRDIMSEKKIFYEDIKPYLEEPPFTESKLEAFVKVFEMSYFFMDISEQDPVCVALNIVADIPLASVAIGEDTEKAKELALEDMYGILKDLTRPL